ncbi:MAG TPA: 3-deoxy-8-phosphooctulonate synthase [Acidobacteriaceae bacterium]|jgi:2-dehydro-3-deoxyphosphooctonate aldolase (KDO 8-P synthase)|nr:3-deoxy-8-phosphooctulonate synthase [Acidobacteriaceae bacterium]
MSREFEIGPVRVGGGRLFLIAGPCVIESEAHVRTMADALQRITSDLGVAFIFKASYDKANRTSVKSFRGPGLVEGTAILRRLAETTGLPVLTDVHEPAHCEIAAEGADVLQIPAFLCRQTDLLVAAGRTGRAINVKKGQFVAPWDMRHAVEKVASTGNQRTFLTERGASFGYNNLVVDMRSLAIMRDLAPVVFDGTHSVQIPSGANGVSGGQPEFIPLLTRAAVAAGVDGLFLEVHDNPSEAKSDGANALDLKDLQGLLETLLAIHAAAHPGLPA